MAGWMAQHVARTMWTAVCVTAAAHRLNFRRSRKERLCRFRFEQQIKLRNINAPAWPESSTRNGRPPPARRSERLLHRDAVRDAADRAKSQHTETRQSADMIADEGQPALMEVPAGLNVGRDLFASR